MRTAARTRFAATRARNSGLHCTETVCEQQSNIRSGQRTRKSASSRHSATLAPSSLSPNRASAARERASPETSSFASPPSENEAGSGCREHSCTSASLCEINDSCLISFSSPACFFCLPSLPAAPFFSAAAGLDLASPPAAALTFASSTGRTKQVRATALSSTASSCCSSCTAAA